MSSCHGANYADVIEEGAIKKACKKEWDALQEAIATVTEDEWNEIARAYSYGDMGINKLINEAYLALCKAFKKKTGLGLECSYHDEEEDEGCEYEGVFWCVSGMYQLSPAGKKMEKYVEREFWVTFG